MRYLILSMLTFTSIHHLLSQNIENDENWKKHSNKNYSINYPSEWTLNTSGQMGSEFILFANPDADADKFQENVNLIIQDVAGYGLDLAKFTDLSITQIKTMIADSKIMSQDKMNQNGKEFMKLNYTGKQGIFDLYFFQYYWVENEKAYILTFTAENEKLSDYQEIASKIMDSFRLE